MSPSAATRSTLRPEVIRSIATSVPRRRTQTDGQDEGGWRPPYRRAALLTTRTTSGPRTVGLMRRFEFGQLRLLIGAEDRQDLATKMRTRDCRVRLDVGELLRRRSDQS